VGQKACEEEVTGERRGEVEGRKRQIVCRMEEIGEGGQLNQDPSSKPGRITAECLKQFTAASTGHCHARRTVLSEISEIRETLAIGLLAGRLLSHILALHVEEKGGQRRTQGYHSSSPSLMNGWRGGVEAEEK
jgi:hypothetical protein